MTDGMFYASVCHSVRKSCQRRDCSELGNIRNWVEHCILEDHGCRKVLNIGGQGSEYWGPSGGGGELFAGCKLIGAPTCNQCQIITFLTLETDNIEKLRIELKSLLLEIPSNKIKGTFIKLINL